MQEHRSQAIECYLCLVTKNGQQTVDAAEQVAECQGFAAKWGGQQVRSWTWKWIKNRELQKSMQGWHVKIGSLLDDPTVAAELRMYI